MSQAMTDGPEADHPPGGPKISPGKASGPGFDDDDNTDQDLALRALLEGAFGPDAMNLIDDEENANRPGEGTSRGEPGAEFGLEDLIAQIDREVGESALPRSATGLSPRRQAAEAGSRFVAFTLAGSHFAVPMDNVLEVQRPPRVTPLPHVPGWVLGVTNLRGEVLSVVDLRAFFGIEAVEYEQSGRMIVVRSTGQEVATGLIVDTVGGALTLPPDRLDMPTATVEGRIEPYMVGVAEDKGRLLVALNLDRLLLSTEMRQFQPL